VTGRLAPVPIEVVRCHYCQQFRPRWRVHTFLRAQTICDYCLEWHNHALEFLAGELPRGCQACLVSSEELALRELGTHVRFLVVVKDGIYQMLCPDCARGYLPKRAEFFKGTQFGKETLNI